MISLTPNGSPAETEAAYGLFAILADPKAAQARLDALMTEKTAAIQASDDARAALAEAKQHANAAAQAQAEIDAARQEIDGRLAIRAKNIEARETAAGQMQDQLSALEKDLSRRESELSKTMAAREADVGNRETAVAKREVATDARQAKIDAAETDFAQRMERLKALAG